MQPQFVSHHSATNHSSLSDLNQLRNEVGLQPNQKLTSDNNPDDYHSSKYRQGFDDSGKQGFSFASQGSKMAAEHVSSAYSNSSVFRDQKSTSQVFSNRGDGDFLHETVRKEIGSDSKNANRQHAWMDRGESDINAVDHPLQIKNNVSGYDNMRRLQELNNAVSEIREKSNSVGQSWLRTKEDMGHIMNNVGHSRNPGNNAATGNTDVKLGNVNPSHSSSLSQNVKSSGSDNQGLVGVTSPINSDRLRPIRQKTRNAVVNILEDGEVCLEFLKTKEGKDSVVEVCKISPDGRKVCFRQYQKIMCHNCQYFTTPQER